MDSSKTISNMQKEVDIWASKFEKPYFSKLSLLAAMTEELGEVARILNHLYGDKKKKSTEELSTLEEELGDLFFSIICLANSEGIDLSDAFEMKMDKVLKRDNNRFQKKQV